MYIRYDIKVMIFVRIYQESLIYPILHSLKSRIIFLYLVSEEIFFTLDEINSNSSSLSFVNLLHRILVIYDIVQLIFSEQILEVNYYFILCNTWNFFFLEFKVYFLWRYVELWFGRMSSEQFVERTQHPLHICKQFKG